MVNKNDEPKYYPKDKQEIIPTRGLHVANT